MRNEWTSEGLRNQLLPRPVRLALSSGVLPVPSRLGLSVTGEKLSIGLRTLGSQAVSGDLVRCCMSGSLSSEAYELSISQDEIVITCGNLAGWRWGLCTLRQLLTVCGEALPCLRIQDHPAFPVRGVMLDVTRGRVWSREHFLQTFRQLSSWKYNLVQLYFETSYAAPGHELIWGHSATITPEELKELDSLASDYGLELCVCQNSFGHLASWLIHPQYRHLAEIQPGDTFLSWGNVSSVPRSLAPLNPQSIDFVSSLLNSFFPYYSSPYINLGCDETQDLGCGCSKAVAEAEGLPTLFSDYVRKLCDIAENAGRRPQIWADFPVAHPEIMPKLPQNLMYLLWGYEMDTPFADWCDLARTSTHDYWVCPGTCSWSAFFGDSTRRHVNMQKAAREGLAGGATGYLLTDWGDGGHRQYWGPSQAALAEGGAQAWNGPTDVSVDVVGREAFGCQAVAQWYEETGKLFQNMQAQKLPSLYGDMITPWYVLPKEGAGNDAKVFAECEKKVRQWKENIPQHAPQLLQQEMSLACDFAMMAAKRGVLRRQGRLVELQQLADSLPPLIEEFKRLWVYRAKKESLPGVERCWREVEHELRHVF